MIIKGVVEPLNGTLLTIQSCLSYRIAFRTRLRATLWVVSKQWAASQHNIVVGSKRCVSHLSSRKKVVDIFPRTLGNALPSVYRSDLHQLHLHPRWGEDLLLLQWSGPRIWLYGQMYCFSCLSDLHGEGTTMTRYTHAHTHTHVFFGGTDELQWSCD